MAEKFSNKSLIAAKEQNRANKQVMKFIRNLSIINKRANKAPVLKTMLIL
jgi:hypothetical protein